MVNIIVTGFFVMGAACALDLVWAKYTLAVTERKPVKAELLSSVIFMLGGSVVTAYVHDPAMLIPAAIGAFIGTYIGCRKSS